MRKKIRLFISNHGLFVGLSILLPITILAIIYAKIGVYPGSEQRTILASDAFSQYANFFASLNNALKGEQSLFYIWNSSLGLNYWAFIAYYLGGIFSPLVVFFNNQQMPDFLYFLTLLKIGCLGGAFWVFSAQTFRLPKWGHVVLSVSYALMSFTLAYSEILMWMDALMYLPLAILGIHRVMDMRKPKLLFISYFLLLASNFYMAFMVGIFSFLYFIARLLTNNARYKKSLPMYFLTSFFACGASMVIVLPTILDLRNNGESLSKIVRLKTQTTGPWDLVIKNMVGMYDSTKLFSTPFIYVGLFGLLFCLFFFMTKKITRRMKLCFGSLLILLVISFYIEPLNLFWQGMHTPNMFNFRFSFLFSFLILTLAGYGWEKYEAADFDQLVTLVLGMLGVFLGVRLLTNNQESYNYFSWFSFVLTLLFLMLYLFGFLGIKKCNGHRGRWCLGTLMLLIVCLEAGMNGYGIIQGSAVEWHYPSRKYYAAPYEPIKALVDQTKEENTSFYRMENLDPVSANDGFNYGYSGISMFSSIRNRHSSYYLNALGYRSLGTNLNIRYANNTLLMDTLMAVKYNIAKQDVLKFGYQKIGEQGEFSLYENENVLPLGILTDEGIYEEGAVQTQATLLNHLAETDEDFFTFDALELAHAENVQIENAKINKTDVVTYTPEDWEKPIVLEWEVQVPAKKQAYVSIYPVDYYTLGSPTVEIEVDGVRYTSAVSETGQYYSLGYHEQSKKLTFKMTISKLREERDVFQIVLPDAAFLDTDKFVEVVKKVQNKGVELKVEKRRATAEVDLEEDQVLFTSIPYDKGWRAYIDGERVEIPTFKQALLTLPISKGKHSIEFVFLPEGLIVGSLALLLCTTGFLIYLWQLKRKENDAPIE